MAISFYALPLRMEKLILCVFFKSLYIKNGRKKYARCSVTGPIIYTEINLSRNINREQSSVNCINLSLTHKAIFKKSVQLFLLQS
jgi:hypothetical protein